MAENDTKRALPLFLVKKGTISPKDIRRIERLSLVCVVESTEPEAVRLLEPPVDADIPAQARAALHLFRWMKDTGDNNGSFAKRDIVKYFVDILMRSDEVQRVDKTKRVK
jgi:hypothetical protein